MSANQYSRQEIGMGPGGASKNFHMGFFRISVKLFALAGFFIIALVSIILYTVSTLDKQKLDAGVINIAGKQRMLTQKLSKSVMELQLGNVAKAGEITEIQKRFKKVLTGLRQGSTELNLPAAESAAIEAKLDEVEQQWAVFSANVDKVKTQWPEIAKRIHLLNGVNVKLFDEANSVVQALSVVMDPVTVFVSGQLPTITQGSLKAILQYIQYKDPQLKKEAIEFMDLQDTIIEGLYDGDTELKLAQVTDPRTLKLISEFEENWQKYEVSAEYIIDALPMIQQAVAYISENNIPMLKAMNSAVQEMANHSQGKIASMTRTEYTILFIVSVIGLVVSFIIINGITKPLEQVSASLGKIGRGDLQQNPLTISSTDEIGLLGNTFNQLLAGMKEYIGHSKKILAGHLEVKDYGVGGDLLKSLEDMLEVQIEKANADRVGALRQAFTESSPNNVMYADVDMNMQYMNAASISSLKKLEQYISIRVDAMMGKSLDLFHKNPAYQRKILSDPSNLPFSSKIQLGPEILQLDCIAIVDQDGTYLGPMVTWAVITELENATTQAQEAEHREKLNSADLKIKVDNILMAVQAAGKGDLTEKIGVTGKDAIGRMGDGFMRFLSSLRNDMSQMASTAQALAASAEQLTGISQQMAGNAEETSSQANVVSAASEQVSANVATVATGAEEMSASIQEIAKNANDAARVSMEAVKIAEETNLTISRLGESSAEIGEVVKVISSIAEQTNLLALNATIEAARAGEAGKGFAVVANEVKELANQTSKATEDITSRVSSIQADTQGAVEAIGRIAKVINQINDISGTIASAVEEQSATTNEIGRNVAEAAKGSNEIATNITGVAQAAKSTSEGAVDTQKSSAELNQMAEQMNSLVAKFKYTETGKEFIPWDPSYSTGVQLFDDQHKILFDLINKLHKGIQTHQEDAILGPILTSLVEYTQTHFAYEEEMFKKHGYADTDKHIERHTKLLDQVASFYEQYQKGQAKIDTALMEFLKDWLNNHIKVVDKEYVHFMVSNGMESAHKG